MLKLANLILATIKSFADIRPNKLILIGTGFNGFSDNAKYLYQELNEVNRLQCFFVCDNPSEINLPEKSTIKRGTFKHFRYSLIADAIFFTHNISDTSMLNFTRSIKVNLWHGIPLKHIGHDSLIEKKWIARKKLTFRKLPYQTWDKCLVPSHFYSERYISAMGLRCEQIVYSGQPRNTILNGSPCGRPITSALNFTPSRVVLYAPTFRSYTSSIKDQIKELLILWSQKSESELLILRLHPLDLESVEYESLPRNIINATSSCFDMQELLLSSDILISDYSSCIYDFSILERPIVLFRFDDEKYIASVGGLYSDIPTEFENVSLKSTANAVVECVLQSYLPPSINKNKEPTFNAYAFLEEIGL